MKGFILLLVSSCVIVEAAFNKQEARELCSRVVMKRFNEYLKASYATQLEALTKSIVSHQQHATEKSLNHAHVVSWSKILDKIMEKFPDEAEYNGHIHTWKAIMHDVVNDLHTIDDEWYLYETFEKYKKKNGKKPFNDFVKIIGESQGACRSKLDAIPKNNGNVTLVKSTFEEFCYCTYNSPANVRPGFKDSNSEISSSMDPLVPKGEEHTPRGEFKRFTDFGKELQVKFNIQPKYYSAAIGGGYVTSDFPLITTADYPTSFDEFIVPDDIDIEFDISK